MRPLSATQASTRLGLLLSLTLALAACEASPAPDASPSDAASLAPDTTEAAGPSDADAAAPSPDAAAPTDVAEAPDAPPLDTPETPDADPAAVDSDAAAASETGEGSDVGATAPVLPEVRPPVVTRHTTTLSPFTLEPGRETTRCVVKRLDNATALWVTDIATRLARGSHHLIIYKSSATEEQAQPFVCDPFVETLKGETVPLMITQIREETLAFPNGVAFRFEPNQMIRLEAHYLNYYPDPIEASAEVRFEGIAESDVVSEANLLFYGNPDLSIAPQSEWTSPWRYLSVLPGTRVFALTGHTHAFGTGVDIQLGTDEATDGDAVYPPAGAPFVWDEPPMAHFSPPLAFDGSRGFRYRCSWNNTSDTTLTFGESARKEMCFFWAYYYPSQGYRLCFSPGDLGRGVTGDEVCCPGHWACDYIAGRL
jgi:hypothetical protein